MNEFDALRIQNAKQEAQALAGSSRPPTMQERLDAAVKQAEERLARVKEAREIFSRNPDLERLLEIMQREHF